MSTNSLFPCYVIDTCALIDLWRRNYRKTVFKSLWKNIETLIANGELVAPREVLNELSQRDDELYKWAKTQKKMFIALDLEQSNQQRIILKEFPLLVNVRKELYDADPHVVALAKIHNWSVVTSEKLEDKKNKIPNICQKYKIKCLKIVDLIEEKRWEY